MTKKWLSLTLLILFSSYLFLFGLGKMALIDPDEPFYAQTAKEMLKSGDCLTPRIFGEPQFEKPPFYYWLTMLSYKAFGINEFAARFPSALFGILGVLGVYLLGRGIFSVKTGIYSALVMTTTVEYVILARACVTDMVLCVFILYAFGTYLYGYLKDHDKRFYLLSAFFMGMAVLTKGPVGIILPAFTIFVYLFLMKDLKALLKFPFFSGTVIFLIVSVPWFYLMWRTHGAEFTGQFFGFQNVTRFLHPEHKSGDVFYYYVPILLGGFFPWTFFTPYAATTLIKKDKKEGQSHIFLLLWIAVFFIFFSISRTKLPTYIFPIFPPIAIMFGRFWEICFKERRFSKSEVISSYLYQASIVGLVVGLFSVIFKKYPIMKIPFTYSAILLLTAVAVSFFYTITRRKKHLFYSIVACIGVVILGVTVFMAVPIGKYESSKYITDELKKQALPGERIGAETVYRRGVAYYMNTDEMPDIHEHHVVTKLLSSEDRVWGILKDKNHRQLYTDPNSRFSVPTYVVYKYGKKVIVTNKKPRNGKFVKLRSVDDPE